MGAGSLFLSFLPAEKTVWVERGGCRVSLRGMFCDLPYVAGRGARLQLLALLTWMLVWAGSSVLGRYWGGKELTPGVWEAGSSILETTAQCLSQWR